MWLTLLLTEPAVIDGLPRARQPTLLVGGEADPGWRPDALADDHSLELLESPGADHPLEIPGDRVASLARLGQMSAAVMRFVDRIYDTG